MEPDIVDRLRRKANHSSARSDAPELHLLLKEAAEAIEALRLRVRLEIKRSAR